MKRISTAFMLVGLVALLSAPGLVQAQGAVEKEAYLLLNLGERGLALNGYDPVAYFQEGRAVQGDSSFQTRIGKAIYYFKSAKNKDTFEAFTQGNFEFGADATAVALTYGAAAGAGTQGASASAGDSRASGGWKRGMAIFTVAKGGLMYEASIGGQKYKFKAR